MARPTKLTEEIVSQIAFGVSRGARPELVAQALGVGRSTYYDWVKRGRVWPALPSDQLCVDLCLQIEKARALARFQLINKIALSNDWRAAAKLLEILDKDWARAGGVPDPTGATGATLKVIVERQPDEDPIVAPDNGWNETKVDKTMTIRVERKTPSGEAAGKSSHAPAEATGTIDVGPAGTGDA